MAILPPFKRCPLIFLALIVVKTHLPYGKGRMTLQPCQIFVHVQQICQRKAGKKFEWKKTIFKHHQKYMWHSHQFLGRSFFFNPNHTLLPIIQPFFPGHHFKSARPNYIHAESGTSGDDVALLCLQTPWRR
jgi:hypothetical protein